jgi:hypothetical protein
MTTRTLLFRGGFLLCSVLLASLADAVEGFSVGSTAALRILPFTTTKTTTSSTLLHASTVAPNENAVEAPECGFVKRAVVDAWNAKSANEYAEMFELQKSEAGFYGLVEAIRTSQIAMGLRGVPFVLRKSEIEAIIMGGGSASASASSSSDADEEEVLFQGFFTMKDLEKALEDDFLDAVRGSTDNRKGWKVCMYSCNRPKCSVSLAGVTSDLFVVLTSSYFNRLRLFPIRAEIRSKKPA